jgi:phosphatidylinositol-3-phosphatase
MVRTAATRGPQRLESVLVRRAVLAVAVSMLATITTAGAATPHAVPARPYVPPIKHVFVINIENKGYDATWGTSSAAPYLAKTLRRKGVLLYNYYATAHNSEPNYIAQLSGQAPNPQMQGDCQIYSTFRRVGTTAPQQAVGQGCVFPTSVPNFASQLTHGGYSWRGYMQDMGTACRHPQLDTQDDTQQARKGDQYAVRHNPFMYFRAITGRVSYCRQHVVGLRYLTHDLRSRFTTRNFSYITPNLCMDGHDSPCVDGRPGGLKSVNAFLRTWVPRILNSPAYKRNGLLIITADESDSPQSDSSSCCNEQAGPNSPLPGIAGTGGGRIGALLISRWIRPNTWSTTPYNHYALLASLEEIFRRPKIGFAQQVPYRFGLDVYNNYQP